MSAAPVWLRDALLALSAAAVLIGIVELCQLARGRRRVLAGYGWETEFTHLLMNAAMAAMMTPLWSGALARTSATAIALCALLLVIVPALRRRPPAGQRSVVVIAAIIHVAAALLMAWLIVGMAPAPMRAMAMPHPLVWLERACAAFFLFDLASVVTLTVFAGRLPQRLRTAAPLMSIVPHVAMDVGMIGMLLVG